VSRGDNTPWRPRRLDGPWGHRWDSWSLPGGTGRQLRRDWQKVQRHREREALRRMEEPEPARPRHSVIYDYW